MNDEGEVSMKRVWVAIARSVRRGVERLGINLGRQPRDGRWRIWIKSLLAIYDAPALIALDVPWWTFDAADRVERFLAGRAGARVFEWGSGASSVWLASRAGTVVSIEHDAAWAQRIATFLPHDVVLRIVPTTTASGAGVVLSRRRGEEGRDFRDYVEAIDREAGRFDLIIIDGRAREACLDRAIARLTEGGMIVFDNVDRERYRRALDAHRTSLDIEWTRGLTPSLPYPTRTALVRVVDGR
jgi:hypothetical protein